VAINKPASTYVFSCAYFAPGAILSFFKYESGDVDVVIHDRTSMLAQNPFGLNLFGSGNGHWFSIPRARAIYVLGAPR
jgi:hypothetical protein